MSKIFSMWGRRIPIPKARKGVPLDLDVDIYPYCYLL